MAGIVVGVEAGGAVLEGAADAVPGEVVGKGGGRGGRRCG